MKNIILNTKDTVDMMEVSRQAFAEWDVKSVKKKDGQVFYNLKTVIAHRRDREKKNSSNLTEIRSDILKQKFEKNKIEIDILKGESISMEIHDYTIETLYTIIKTQVLALPSKLTTLLQDVKTRERHKIITKECRDVLSQAADNIEAAQKANRKSMGT